MMFWLKEIHYHFLEFGYGSAISYLVMLISGIFGYYYVKTMAYEK